MLYSVNLWILAFVLTVTPALASNPTGSADQVLRIPGAGGLGKYGQVDLSKTAATKNQLPASRGGTGQDFSASTGFLYDTSGTLAAKTSTQATALLDNFVGDSGSGGTAGLVPAPAAGDAAALKFLSAGGTFAVPNRPALGQQVSGSCSSFSTTSATYVDVTNLTRTITTTGRPVMVCMQPDGGSIARVQLGGNGDSGTLALVVDGSTLYEGAWSGDNGAGTNEWGMPMCWLDYTASAALHTYKMQAKTSPGGGGHSFFIFNWRLVVFEL